MRFFRTSWLVFLALAMVIQATGAEPGAKLAVRTDAQGDPLPEHVLARLGSLRFRNGAPIQWVHYLADGKTLASVGSDGGLRHWEADTGKEKIAFGGVGITYSPDGLVAATNEANGTLKLTNIVSGKESHVGVMNFGINNFSFGQDGKTVAVALTDNTNGLAGFIRVFDVASGKELRDLHGPAPAEGQQGFIPNNVVFSADGKVVAALGQENNQGNRIRLWEAATGKLLPDVVGENNNNNGVFALSPDGKLLLQMAIDPMNGTQKLSLTDTATGKHVRNIGEQINNGLTALNFSPDGKKLIVGEGNQTMKLFDVATGKEIPSPDLTARNGFIMGHATFSSDGTTVAVASGDGSVRIIDTVTGKLVQNVDGLEANVQQNFINQFNMGGMNWGPLSFSKDGKRLAGAGHHGMVRIWDVATGKEVKQAEVGHDGTVSSVTFSADGKSLLTVGDDNVVLLWDRAKNTVKQRFSNPTVAEGAIPQPPGLPVPTLAPALAMTPNGRRLAIGWSDGTVQVLETETAKELHKFKTNETSITAMLFTSDGRSVITSSLDGKVVGWTIATGKQFHHFAGPVGEAPANPEEVFGSTQAITRSPDGRLFATVGMTPDGTHSVLRIWELATGKVRREIKVKRATNDGNWAPAPGLAGFGGFGGARFVAAAFGEIDASGAAGASLLRFAPDGRTMAWANGNNIELWNLDRGREIRRFGLAEGMVADMDFAPDGKTVAAAGSDGTVRLWEVATGTALVKLEGHRGSVTAVAFALDGKILATGGADTTVNLWDVPAALAAAQASPTALAQAELEATWTQFVGEDSEKVSAALDRLAGSPAAAVALAKQHAKPVAAPEPARLAKLVAELEDAKFETRQQAAESLEKLGELADKALRKRLDDNPSLDVRQRIEELLDKSSGLVSLPEHIRALRVVELLERIGTPEAKAVLQDVAKGAADARLTRDAAEALDRLNGKK